jgi:hypothetical protein
VGERRFNQPACLQFRKIELGGGGLKQAERIQSAVLKSIHSRDPLRRAAGEVMLKALSEAEIRVKAELARIGEGTLLKGA